MGNLTETSPDYERQVLLCCRGLHRHSHLARLCLRRHPRVHHQPRLSTDRNYAEILHQASLPCAEVGHHSCRPGLHSVHHSTDRQRGGLRHGQELQSVVWPPPEYTKRKQNWRRFRAN